MLCTKTGMTGLFFLLLSAGTARAQEAALPPAAEASGDQGEIVVTAIRPGDTILLVDYRAVARRCAECKRALAEMEELGRPVRRKKEQIRRDAEQDDGAIESHLDGSSPLEAGNDIMRGFEGVGIPGRSAVLTNSARRRQRQDHVEYAAGRRDVAKLAATYLAQLEARVVPIVEALKQKHRAAGAFDKYQRGLPEARQKDVTEEVIRQLDRSDFKVVLTQ